MSRLSFLRLALRSAWFYRRTNLSVLLGTAVAAAVLVGALLVGDSVRYSLRRLADLRLGAISLAMDTDARFFDPRLADRLAPELGVTVAPALKLRGMILAGEAAGGRPRQLNAAQILGVDQRFWRLSAGDASSAARGRPGFDPALGPEEAAVSRKTAVALDLRVGDEIGLRVGKPALMPRDAPLASRRERLSSRSTLTVKAIVPDGQLGRFSLSASQIAPHNVFVALDWLQRRLELPRRANLLLAGGGDATALTPETAGAALKKVWRIEDAGLTLRPFAERGVLQLESRRVFLDPAAATAARRAEPGAVGVLNYLVNAAVRRGEDGERATPYSFVTACSPAPGGLSPVPAAMQDDEILICRWLADRLGAGPGDTVELRYSRLAADNSFVAETRAFRVRDIVEMADLSGERELTPDFPGLTDVEQCRDWDIGLPMDETLLADEANEAYWKEYGPTPKALVTLRAGQSMWANRFGDLTAARFAAGPGREEALRRSLAERIDPSGLGLFFRPVRAQSRRAVEQGLDFGELFVGMSFFLIAAALMLTGLLFVFGVTQRSAETGALMAVGFRARHVRRLFLLEGGAIAALGSASGAALGTLYTRAMVWGLSTHWRGAVAGAALRYHAEPGTVAAGSAAALACAVLAMGAAMWRQARRPARDLLSGLPDERPARRGAGRRRPLSAWAAAAAAAGAAGIVAYALAAGPRAAVAAFFAAGALLLLAGLFLGRHLLARLAHGAATDARAAPAAARLTLYRLGVRNAARRRNRSLTAGALLACGAFMVIAVSSMQEDVRAHAAERWSGTGGFALFARATLPVPDDPGTAAGRKALGMDRDERLREADIVALKVYDGDDASCLNLNRAQAPVLLGIDAAAMSRRGAFCAARDGAADVWNLLDTDLAGGEIPALAGDANTAMWGLEKSVGVERGARIAYRDERGEVFYVKLVGALPTRLSVFQGALLVRLDAFNARFPSEEGYRMFLVDAPPDRAPDVGAALTERMAEAGMDVAPAVDRLEEFHAVENAYLRMFLVLGGLGLLLGSLGLGIVVMRNVLERRAELALLRCTGFSMRDVTRVLLAEHWLLVIGGLCAGVASAVIAMWPNLRSPGVGLPLGAIGLIVGSLLLLGLGWTARAARAALRGRLIAALRNE